MVAVPGSTDSVVLCFDGESVVWKKSVHVVGRGSVPGGVHHQRRSHDHIAMLILGRIMVGVGVGFANQSVPVYLSEMAPAKMRGALNIGFQMAITIGILVANLVNYATAPMKGGIGWRVSVGGAGFGHDSGVPTLARRERQR